jgi:hypothetical protein
MWFRVKAFTNPSEWVWPIGAAHSPSFAKKALNELIVTQKIFTSQKLLREESNLVNL